MSVGSALVVATDGGTIQHFSRALQEVSISPDICREPAAAQRLLNCRKFDAVIVDLELGAPAATVLNEVRLSPSNHTAVTFVIGSGSETVPELRRQSSFVFERPLSPASIRRILRPAYGLILRERRRYFRCPLTVPLAIFRTGLPPVSCQSRNLSEGGMAVSTFVPLRPGEEVSVRFSLPGGAEPFSLEATVCWWKTGQLGVRFVSFPADRKSELQTWLAEKLEQTLPEFVAATFQKTAGVH
jgi:PilZ domain-containing protein